jgi:hypothetical protein
MTPHGQDSQDEQDAFGARHPVHSVHFVHPVHSTSARTMNRIQRRRNAMTATTRLGSLSLAAALAALILLPAPRASADSILAEDFESAFPPVGWEALAAPGSVGAWLRNDAYYRPNHTAPLGSGYSAAVDPHVLEMPGVWDAELRSPAIVVPAAGATLTFFSYYEDFTHPGVDRAWLDAQRHDLAAWDNLLVWDLDHLPNPTTVTVSLAPYAGDAIRLRWRYTMDNPDLPAWRWQMDGVRVLADPSPTPSPTPSSSPTPSATPTPSVSPTLSPTPTARPRAGWTLF